jgi:hypothetical protein
MSSKAVTWSWKSDNGWKKYPADMSRKIEAGFQKCKKAHRKARKPLSTVPVGEDRCVDFLAKPMVQRRNDDPTKYRLVKRDPPSEEALSASDEDSDEILLSADESDPATPPAPKPKSQAPAKKQPEPKSTKIFKDMIFFYMPDIKKSFQPKALGRTSSEIQEQGGTISTRLDDNVTYCIKTQEFSDSEDEQPILDESLKKEMQKCWNVAENLEIPVLHFGFLLDSLESSKLANHKSFTCKNPFTQSTSLGKRTETKQEPPAKKPKQDSTQISLSTSSDPSQDLIQKMKIPAGTILQGVVYSPFPFSLKLTKPFVPSQSNSLQGEITWPSCNSAVTRCVGKFKPDNSFELTEEEILAGEDEVCVPNTYVGKLIRTKEPLLKRTLNGVSQEENLFIKGDIAENEESDVVGNFVIQFPQ